MILRNHRESLPSAMMKVGTLARKTGLTVRTLHYYDEIGLLSPAHRSEAGYRLYSAVDVARLQRITSLRHLGFSLEAIRDCLDQPAFSPARVVQLHLAHVKEKIKQQQQQQQRLEVLAAYLRTAGEVPVDKFIQTIQSITMTDQYYTPEQLETLHERAQAIGEERLRRYEAEWQELIDAVRAEMNKGTDPASEAVQQLARRWNDLIEAFTGGDPGIRQSLNTMYKQEGPAKASRGMVDEAVMAYIGQTMKAAT